jgi:hypothetical protein
MAAFLESGGQDPIAERDLGALLTRFANPPAGE